MRRVGRGLNQRFESQERRLHVLASILGLWTRRQRRTAWAHRPAFPPYLLFRAVHALDPYPEGMGWVSRVPGHLASNVLSGSVDMAHWPVFVVAADGSGECFARWNVGILQMAMLELSNSVKEFGDFRSRYTGLRLFGEL